MIILTIDKKRQAKNYMFCTEESEAELMLEVALDTFKKYSKEREESK